MVAPRMGPLRQPGSREEQGPRNEAEEGTLQPANATLRHFSMVTARSLVTAKSVRDRHFVPGGVVYQQEFFHHVGLVHGTRRTRLLVVVRTHSRCSPSYITCP